jgi:hypothetical protein
MADTKEHVSNQPQVCPIKDGTLNVTSESSRVLCVYSQGTAPMSVGGNRNAKNCPLGPDGKRGWSFGLFDCFARCGLCT